MSKTTSKTLLKDEKLGVMREYDEVQRKAKVGELVKSEVDSPPVFEVKQSLDGAVTGGRDGIPTMDINYVVLEPTDVIRVNGERYRMVERKAEVGEKVIVVADALRNISLGVTGKCTVNDEFDDGSIDFSTETGRSHFLDVDGGEQDYRVLIPLPSANTPKPDADTLGLIANLTAKVTAMDKRIKALEERLLPKGSLKEPTITVKPSDKAEAMGLRLTRDDVIEMAKKDVEALKERMISEISNTEGNDTFRHFDTKPEFTVNREKRTVVALVKGAYNPVLYTKGIAKTAPDDVFNASIGRAIALRRALGLDIPSEYTNAPQPTEARVGDIIKTVNGNQYEVYAVRPTHRTYGDGAGGKFVSHEYGLTYIADDDCEVWAHIDNVKVIDDSRE